ncbi:hypothetical protein FEM21_13190 [Flavobacterium seoulense]|uniref:General secretion pathway protein n=1 Tax=Flavobacterium seoulense TaxID=1492738 RepID=A0A066WNW0_9FLAO|nr:hypothetical protein FEM21_13190 [Flavobacterium seoulense]
MWLLKLLILGVFSLIFFQDYKDRKVYWFLYPVVGILVFILQAQILPLNIALINSGVNLLLVLFLLIFSYLYARLKLKKSLLQSVLGLGDILFFIAIAFSFSIVSFWVLFVFSLIFSLILHLVLKYKQIEKTVPLAGYMSLFFAAVYSLSFFCNFHFLYAY